MKELLVLLLVAFCATVSAENFTLPEGFLIGTATASYQIEGAWDEDGKGENIWDHDLHENPSYTEDEKNGDVADDAYHHVEEDVQLMVDMKLNAYRFSISWGRILPKGDLSKINQEGIDYYNNLIDELLKYNIEPMVTMYHWDLPYELQKLGGWANRHLAFYFEDYADILYKAFGDRVKYWITINEPQVYCRGYANEDGQSPHIDMPGIGDYLCGHTVLLSHAKAYHLYNEKYRDAQKGLVGITLNSDMYIPKDPDSTSDVEAADRGLQFWLGWFAHPIFSAEGDYPKVMRERIDANSEKEGFIDSRLPKFTSEEIKQIQGSSDFFGLNTYTTKYTTDGGEGQPLSKARDAGVVETQDPEWPSSGSSWLKVYPKGFGKLLRWINSSYDGPDIYVTENGFSDRTGVVEDINRVNYFKGYLSEMAKAMQEGVTIKGYMAWSFLDNFEWSRGYLERFGVHYVDYESDDRKRTPKDSSKFLKSVAETKEIEIIEEEEEEEEYVR